MARDVDRVLDFIRSCDFIPPVHRQVMINRLDAGMPTPQELERAKNEVFYGSSPG